MRKRVLSLLTTLALMRGLCTPLGRAGARSGGVGGQDYGVSGVRDGHQYRDTWRK